MKENKKLLFLMKLLDWNTYFQLMHGCEFIRSELDFGGQSTIIRTNNTPPASRLTFGLECSAPRGVTHLWGIEK
ncbi:hypothetical protein LH51_12145 [Nitrincola sp. A-D6]|uniref:hypothetical protein n=1 Tax=Nitrincola sp. A-D6 TaxID=1545442 RepID=UPI00051FDD07|nr:hypothetical protein [Nitrincola sp. A-D6]KGK41779.1 hypothetical protein LH51_12145 [Nitrincola sp. A-D6]